MMYKEEDVIMGRKRKRRTTNSAKKNTRKKNNIDLVVIGSFVLGVLLTILIYGETGAMGEMMSPVLGGIVGVIKYVIPLGFIGISISLVKDDKDYFFSKLCQYIVFLACIAAMMSIFQVSKGNLNMQMEFSDVLERAYELGTSNIGGGTVGTVISYPLIKLFGMFGAAVVTTGIAIIMLVFTFGLKPAQFIIEILDMLEERKELRRDEMESELEARREERIARARVKAQSELQQNKKIQKNAKKSKKTKSSGLYNIDDDEPIMGQEIVELPEIDDDQITINLNNQKNKEDEIDISIFKGKDKKPEIKQEEVMPEKEEMNPNEIESNLFVQKAL